MLRTKRIPGQFHKQYMRQTGLEASGRKNGPSPPFTGHEAPFRVSDFRGLCIAPSVIHHYTSRPPYDQSACAPLINTL